MATEKKKKKLKVSKEKKSKKGKKKSVGAKRVGSHPKHPKCPECGKAIYKTMTKGGAVKKTDPWAYCRNEDCIKFGLSQAGKLELPGALPPKEAKRKPKEPADKTEEEISVIEKKNAKKAKKKKKKDPTEETKGEKRRKKKKKLSPIKKKRAAIRKDLATGKYNTTTIAQRNECSRKLVMSVRAKEVKKQTDEN